jgi:hypothetical protein
VKAEGSDYLFCGLRIILVPPDNNPPEGTRILC